MVEVQESTPKIELPEREAMIVAAMQAIMMHGSSGLDSRGTKLAIMASCGVVGIWMSYPPDDGLPERGPLHALWRADESWFGPGFVDSIRIRNGEVYCPLLAQKLALAFFSLEMARRFETVLPQLWGWLSRADNDRNSQNDAELHDLLKVFENPRFDLDTDLIADPEIPARLLREMAMFIKTMNKPPNRSNWKEILELGCGVLTVGAAFLHLIETTPQLG